MHEVEDLGAFIALNVAFIIVMIGQLWGELESRAQGVGFEGIF